ncbi:glycosyltransferase family 2 protein [Xylocopilactobacillus apicola]|uniref:Bactoprenol glucosyl transferase n=1 Tax=Xylocopilactobacillus apicola TaxID=2932184 RepID=A0AAU9DTR9_9LACO|nr:glycosyltransferase family 2 protein [Xylocopilactobacillus apicola]BDR58823.1 bactoprenol glucosyl transferase [Xylocopilactobacillus apicola]
MKQKLISIIIPCYNEALNISTYFNAMQEMFSQIPNDQVEYHHEYIFIDDGSKDNTLKEIDQLQSIDPTEVHYISFARNFGKEAAFLAGLEAAKGDYVAVMDVDLQDPPEMLPEMLNGINEEGYDVVGCRRVDRSGEPPIRSFFAQAFYKFINRISSTKIVEGARDYRLMTRQVVDAILQMPEYNRFSKGIFSWVGFKTKYLPYQNVTRNAGETHFTFSKLLRYSLDGIVDFSDLPLSLASFVGLLTFALSIVAMIFVIVRRLMFGDRVSGWASLVTIILFIGGLQLFCLGIVGKYIGRIYLETKRRPVYIIKKKK